MFITDKKIQNYFDKLMKDMVVELPPRLAQDIGRHKTIQNIRKMDKTNPYILICRDQKYHISIIKMREPVKIIKKGDRYIFSL